MAEMVEYDSAERRAAYAAYWAARTPAEEREAYMHMMAIGIPDGYRAHRGR